MLHVCIQHLYFYEDINTVNKLYFYSPCSFLLNLCASVFASLNKVENTNLFKISQTQKTDSNCILKEQTPKRSK